MPMYIIAFFLLKIAVGCLYGYWYSKTNASIQPDTWRFHEEGLKEYHLLLSDPGTYFSNLFHNDYDAGWWRFFTPADSYWNDLRDNLMVKIVSLMDLFSGGNYYVNVVLYSFFTFFAFIFLYKTFSIVFKEINSIAALFIFLTPSCLFWTSGIHKDGLILLFLSSLLYHLAKICCSVIKSNRSYLIIFLMLLFIFPFRNYITLILIPCIVALLITTKARWNAGVVFSCIFLICSIIFFAGKYIHPKLNFPQKISYRQAEFHALEGNSRLTQKDLEPNFKSFVLNAPEALNHSLLRPYLWESKKIFEIAAAIEVIILLIVIILSFIYPLKNSFWKNDYVIFIFFFIVPMLLLIGYTVPFAGSIVRYRAIYFMILLVLFAQKIDWSRLKPNRIK